MLVNGDPQLLELIHRALRRHVPTIEADCRCGMPPPECQTFEHWIINEWLWVGRNLGYLVGQFEDHHCFLMVRNADNVGDCATLMPHAPNWKDVVRCISACELSGLHTMDGPRPIFLKHKKTGRPILAIA